MSDRERSIAPTGLRRATLLGVVLIALVGVALAPVARAQFFPEREPTNTAAGSSWRADWRPSMSRPAR